MGILTALLNPSTWLIAGIAALVMGATGWYQGHSGKAEAVATAARAAQIEGFNEATELAFEQFEKDQKIVKAKLAKEKAQRAASEKSLKDLEAYRATNPPSYATACDLDDDRMRILTDAIAGSPSNPGGAGAAVPAPAAPAGTDAGGLRPSDGGKRAPAPRVRGPGGRDGGVPGAGSAP